MTATREEAIEVLQRLFDWKYNSLPAYLLEAESYAAPAAAHLNQTVAELASEDQALSGDLAAAIRELQAIPHVNPPAQDIAELNYLSIVYLCNVLLERLNEQLAFANEIAGQLGDFPVAREVTTRFQQVTSSQIEKLTKALAE